MRKYLMLALVFAVVIFGLGYAANWTLAQFSPYQRLSAEEMLAQNSAPGGTAQAAEAATPALPDRTLGKANAPVTIIEYASLTCPHCAHFHTETLPQIKAEYIDKGLVKLIFRPFPFDAVALRGSLMAYCLPENQFHGFLTAVFAAQEEWAKAADPGAELRKIARLAGLSDEKLAACEKSPSALSEAILRARVQGEKDMGVESTPTFFINGETIKGARPFATFKNVIEAELKKAKNN
jgi:protein-disulfide isomerase